MGRFRVCAWALAVLVIGAFPASAAAGVAPKPVGQIDCNGFSPIQRAAHHGRMRGHPRHWAGAVL